MLRNIFIVGIISLSLAVATVSSSEFDIEKFLSQVPEGILPEGYGSFDHIEKVIKQHCQRVSKNEGVATKAVNATKVLIKCLYNATNQEMLEAGASDGTVVSAFNKFCSKRTIAIECLAHFNVVIEPCLNENEVASKKTFVNIFTNLLNFACQNDGNQIALFIDKKGQECLKNKQDALIQCINTTMYADIQLEKTKPEDIVPKLTVVQQCNDLNALQYCVVKELESCENSIPANVAESIFEIVRNETPCATGCAAITQKTSWIILSTALFTIFGGNK